MTQILTTEQLKRVIKLDDVYNPAMMKAMARELMANREAQPVALSTVFGDKRAVTIHAETAEVWNSDGLQVQSPYTAPPAPAVPDGFKLMPLEMTDEIGEAIAMEARCCGGIALCIYEAALAAAPENVNGA